MPDVVEALRAGRSYAVSRINEVASALDTTLGAVTLDGETVSVTCVGEPSTFLFIGQNGVIRKTVKDATSASYTFGRDDTYVRTVIRSPRTAMYLNPVIRTEDGRPMAPMASVNAAGTWVLRASFAMAGVALYLLYRTRGRFLLSSPPRTVLAPADRETA
jgi:hypothetical protein